MRISGISSYNYNNYNKSAGNNVKKNNVSFGRFRDENAERELQKVVDAEIERSEYAKYYAPPKLDAIRNCSFVEVYTDEKANGKIRVAYDEKRLDVEDKNLDYCMRWYDDLRSYKNLAWLAGHIDIMTKVLLGIDCLEAHKSDPKADEEEAARLRRIEEERTSYPYLAF